MKCGMGWDDLCWYISTQCVWFAHVFCCVVESVCVI